MELGVVEAQLGASEPFVRMKQQKLYKAQNTLHSGGTVQYCCCCGGRQHSRNSRTLDGQGSMPGPAIGEVRRGQVTLSVCLSFSPEIEDSISTS